MDEGEMVELNEQGERQKQENNTNDGELDYLHFKNVPFREMIKHTAGDSKCRNSTLGNGKEVEGISLEEYDDTVTTPGSEDSGMNIYDEIPGYENLDPQNALHNSDVILNSLPGDRDLQYFSSKNANGSFQPRNGAGKIYGNLNLKNGYCSYKRKLLGILKIVSLLIAVTFAITAFPVILWQLRLINFGSLNTESENNTPTPDIELTTFYSTIPRYAGTVSAFSVHSPLTIGQTDNWRNVQFGKAWSAHEWFNGDTYFVLPFREVYLTCLSALYEDNVNYSLEGSPYNIGLSTSGHWNPVGRDILLDIPGDTTLYIEYTGNLWDGLSTSWSMFSVSGAMDPLIAFTATRTTPFSTAGQLKFQNPLLNRGEGYDQRGEFIAPTNGTYYFSVSTGVAARQGATLQLRHNEQCLIELVRSDTIHIATAMLSSAVLVNLTQGDRVHVKLVDGSLHSSVEYTEISFSGFLYAPIHGQKYAWSAWMSKSWSPEGLTIPVPYDKVLVNNGGVYNTSEHVVTIHVSGVYYVHLVGGVKRGYDMDMTIYVGKSMQEKNDTAYIFHDGTGINGIQTVSQSILLTLKAGDKVWVMCYKDRTWFYSNQNLVTGFSGFLVNTI